MIQVHPKLDKVAMKCHSCRVNLGPLGDPARLQKETSCGRERERGGGVLGEKLERPQVSFFPSSSFGSSEGDLRMISNARVLEDPVRVWFNLAEMKFTSLMLPTVL